MTCNHIFGDVIQFQARQIRPMTIRPNQHDSACMFDLTYNVDCVVTQGASVTTMRLCNNSASTIYSQNYVQNVCKQIGAKLTGKNAILVANFSANAPCTGLPTQQIANVACVFLHSDVVV